MDMNSTGVSVYGVAFLIISLLVFTVGVLLLIFGISSTIKRKKSIGRIVAGGILVIHGLVLTFFSVMIVLSGASNKIAMNSEDVNEMNSRIIAALESNDPDEMAALSARSGYSGDVPDLSGMNDFFFHIDGKITSVNGQPVGSAYRNKVTSYTFWYAVKTDSSKSYTVQIDFIVSSPDESHIGVQQIILKDGRDVIGKYGTKPDFGTMEKGLPGKKR